MGVTAARTQVEVADGCPVPLPSFGVMLNEIMSGDVPFKGKNPYSIMHQVGSLGKRPDLCPPKKCPTPVLTIIQRCWAGNGRANSRPSMAEVAEALAAILKDPVSFLACSDQ